MTDLVNGMNQTSEVSQDQPPVDNLVEKPSQSSERVFNQSQVNEIVKKAKYGAVEDYKRLQSQQPQYAQEKYGIDSSLSNNISQESLNKMIEEAAAKHIEKAREDAYLSHQREMAHKIVENFKNKTQSGKEKFSDFDTVTGDINDIMGQFPRVVELLADHVDNADEVYYEFGKDMLKMSSLQALADASMPAAIKEIKRFAKSLKDNDEAKRYRQPNEPLSQLRPSNTGTDTGAMSVSDYRKKYKA